jgi:hypothetical protein
MAILKKVWCYQDNKKVVNIEVSYWIEKELRERYKFKPVMFAGEIDHYLEVTKEELKKIHLEQIALNPHVTDPITFDYKAYKELENLINSETEYDKIEIVLFVWYSGY